LPSNLQAIQIQSDYEEQKLLAEQRLAELEKLTENYKGSLEEIEKQKMEVRILIFPLGHLGIYFLQF
jgi:SMC interacting uncharacterized protein involved in chromosome segregation